MCREVAAVVLGCCQVVVGLFSPVPKFIIARYRMPPMSKRKSIDKFLQQAREAK